MTEARNTQATTNDPRDLSAGDAAVPTGLPLRALVMMKPNRPLRRRADALRDELRAAGEPEMMDRLIRILDDPRTTRDHKAAALIRNIDDLARSIVRLLEEPVR